MAGETGRAGLGARDKGADACIERSGWRAVVRTALVHVCLPFTAHFTLSYPPTHHTPRTI